MSEVGLGQRWEGVCPSRFCPRPYFSLLQIFGPHVTDFKTLWHPIARLWNLFESGSKLVDFLVLKKGTLCILWIGVSVGGNVEGTYIIGHGHLHTGQLSHHFFPDK